MLSRFRLKLVAYFSVLLGVSFFIFSACSDDRGILKERGGLYRIHDLDVDCARECDTIRIQFTDVHTGEQFEITGEDDGFLERLMPLIKNLCLEHPEDKDLIRIVACR